MRKSGAADSDISYTHGNFGLAHDETNPYDEPYETSTSLDADGGNARGNLAPTVVRRSRQGEPMPYEDHKKQAQAPVTCAVITVSDTRTEADDKSGKIVREHLEASGHRVGSYQIVADDPDLIRRALASVADGGTCQAVLTNGGTGIAARDTTYEAVVGLLEKRLDGFGELFRFLSWEEIGSGAMLSRAVAGVYRDLMVFCLPGSSGAVRLAMEKLIVPELSHLVWEIWRQK